MIKRLLLFLLALTPAGAATIPIHTSMTTAQIQTAISGAATGTDTVAFDAGTFNLTAGLILKCGVTYTGPVATPATAILHGSFARESAIIFSLLNPGFTSNPCTQATTIEYLDFDFAAGIRVQTSFTNITITHNQFTNTPCCNSQLNDTMLFFDGSQASTNSQQILGAATVTWNSFGDGVNSCETPGYTGPPAVARPMEAQIPVPPQTGTTIDSTTGACSGIRENGSVNGPVVIEFNSFNHLGNALSWGCPPFNTSRFPCEPSTTGPQTGSGAKINNVIAKWNDFSGVHRITWEMQVQQTSGIDLEYNSYHDPYFPYFGTFGLSLACCENGATSPFLIVNNNALVDNTASPPCPGWFGFGIEAHGTQASYSNNLVQGLIGEGGSCPRPTPGIAWGFGANPRNYANNYVCGPFFAGQYIVTELNGYPTPSNLTGNVTATSCHATTSMAPTISPTPTGTYSAPISVTLTDPGYSSGSQPLGNTTIYYTTDGSTPTTNSAVCNIVPATSCTISVAQGSTVNAIGMWGSGANVKTYPAGYGFVPSAVVGAHYISSGGGSPTLTGVTFSLQGGGSGLLTGNTIQACGTTAYTGSINNLVCGAGPDSQLTTLGTWTSSNPAAATINPTTGVIQGVGPGTTTLSVKATASGGSPSFTSTPAFTLTVTSSTPVLTGVTISDGGVGSIGSTQTVQAQATANYTVGGTSTTQNCTGTANIYNTICNGWASSNTSAATINGTGNVSGAGPGTTNLTVKATGPGGPAPGTAYFISPTGSDSNSGTSSGSPWLTPNHAVNCGDTITAAAGTYSASNFGSGSWGTVSCPAGNNVAWLICGTFDTCKITSTSSDAMWVSKSFWGVQGWETSVTGGTNGACFHAGPTSGVIHHIIFANNVANGCMGGGFNSYSVSTSSSVDYIAYVGNVAYNAAQGTGACYSGLNIYQPIASDSVAGTHMYVAGNFSYNNVDGSPCSGGLTTDGEGINLDTFDFSQGGGTAYTQQAVVQNNIAVGNGSSGVLMENNKTGPGSAPTYFKQNTTYGNLKATNRSFCTGLGELYAQAAFNVTATGNLAMTNAATGCMGDPIYAFSVANGNGTVSVSGNWLYSAAGNTTFISSSPGFSYGSNTTGTNPAFTSTTVPGAPSCSGKANVPSCMATMIANFTPTAPGSTAFGYQAPSLSLVTDSLFPTWLCNTNLPPGLVSSPCGTTFTSLPLALTVTAPPPPATLTGVTVSCASSSVVAGNSDACAATCLYSVAPNLNCTTMDAHGNTATSWASDNTATATINSTTGVAMGVAAGSANITVHAGSFTSPNYVLTVTAIPPANLFLGNSLVTPGLGGFTSANYVNNVYAVTGPNLGGYNVQSCSISLPVAYPAGSKVDCVVNLAPSATTRSASDLCWATYTATGTSADVGTQTLPISGCGLLAHNQGYWIESVTNATGTPGYNFYTCGGTTTPACTGGAPTSGNGTYQYYFQSSTYGVHSGLTTALHLGANTQPTQFLTLSTPLATLNGGIFLTPGATTILSVGGSAQFVGYCTYSDGTAVPCWPTPDQFGNTFTHFTSSDPTKMTVGDIGSAHPALAVGVSVGTANVQGTVTGGLAANPWPITISNTPLPYPPSSPRGLK